MKACRSFQALCWVALLGVFSGVVPEASGQAMKVQIEAGDPKFDDLASPEVGGNTGKKNWKPKDWLEFEVKIELEARPEPEDEFIDRIQVDWYVAVKNPERRGPDYLLLEKEVSYVNVPVDEEVYISAYLSPATIKRLTGRDRAGKSVVWGVGGEIVCPGAVRPVRFSSKPLDDRAPWWTSGKLQRSDKFPLLDKNETPFKFLWWDRYLEIEASGR